MRFLTSDDAVACGRIFNCAICPESNHTTRVSLAPTVTIGKAFARWCYPNARGNLESIRVENPSLRSQGQGNSRLVCVAEPPHADASGINPSCVRRLTWS